MEKSVMTTVWRAEADKKAVLNERIDEEGNYRISVVYLRLSEANHHRVLGFSLEV